MNNDVTPQDGLDIVHFLKYVLDDKEYKRVIDKVFDVPDESLTPITIPAIYDIPDEVQANYNDRGFRLVKQPSCGNS